MWRGLVVIVAAVVSVLVSEILTTTILHLYPADVDMASNFFGYAAFPGQVATVGIAAIALTKIFNRHPVWYPILFTLVYAGTHAYELVQFNNPMSDVAWYLGLILLVCIVIFTLMRRMFWQDQNQFSFK